MSARPSLLLPLLALCVWTPIGAAQGGDDPVTIYRCTGADGQLALRDTPCTGDAQQQAIRMQRPKDPPPRPMYECVTPDGDRYTSDSSEGNPRWVPLWTLGYPARPPYAYPRRPVDLPARPAAADGYLRNELVFDGIGRPAPPPPGDTRRAPELPPAVGLAYTQGRWIRDTCERLPPAEVCQRLRDRHWELGRQYNSALQSERREIDAEQRRITARVDSECAG